MNALRIILSALLIGVAGWMMFDHALKQKFFDLNISHELKTSRRLDDWQRRQDLNSEWKTFAQEQKLTWQLNDRTSWSLSGPSKTKDNVEHFVSSWNTKEEERVRILAEEAQKELQSTRERKNGLRLDLAWTEQSIQKIEKFIQQQELSVLNPVEDIEPAQMDDEPEAEHLAAVELNAPEMMDEPDTDNAPETQDTLEIDDTPQMDDEPESLSDVFSDLLQMDTTGNSSSGDVDQENITVTENVSSESPDEQEKPTSDLSELFTDIMQSTESLIEDNLTPAEENVIPGLDQIVGAIQSSTASINAQLGMSQEQSSSQAHGLKEDVSKLTE